MLGNADDAADAAQQTFVQAYTSLPRARLDMPLRPWLFRIARNACIDRIRARRSAVVSAFGDDRGGDAAIEAIVDFAPLPEQLVEHRDLQRLLAETIRALPERYRSTVAMRYTTDLTFAEIGQALGLPENTVKTHFQRAKALLRVALASRLSDPPG
jgi:RNA polymerase sigma-70 factor (ECF subfamily)